MFNLNFPANFCVLNDFLINVVTFDVVPKINAINAYFFTTYFSDAPLTYPSVGFGLNGFETHNYAKNTGSLYIFAGWMIGSSIFFQLMR